VNRGSWQEEELWDNAAFPYCLGKLSLLGVQLCLNQYLQKKLSDKMRNAALWIIGESDVSKINPRLSWTQSLLRM